MDRPKATDGPAVWRSYATHLESEVERLRGQLHEMLVDPDNTVSSTYLRHEALRAKLERVWEVKDGLWQWRYLNEYEPCPSFGSLDEWLRDLDAILNEEDGDGNN